MAIHSKYLKFWGESWATWSVNLDPCKSPKIDGKLPFRQCVIVRLLKFKPKNTVHFGQIFYTRVIMDMHRE